MAQSVYTMQGVTKIVPPQRTILQNINLSFYPGAKIGVLGLNGSGKSSLLRIMAGEDTEIDGEARAQKDIRVGYLPQEPGLDDDLDVRGNVELGVAPIMAILKEYNDISDRFAEPMDDDEMTKLLERQGDLATEIDAVEGWEIDRTLDIAADALRLPAWDTPVVSLSGGERRRVALCALLLSKPDMLLLDEPTNHLDAESVSWLERFLDEYPGTVVAVTHDRYFLDNVASWILELDRGRGLPYDSRRSRTGRIVHQEKVGPILCSCEGHSRLQPTPIVVVSDDCSSRNVINGELCIPRSTTGVDFISRGLEYLQDVVFPTKNALGRGGLSFRREFPREPNVVVIRTLGMARRCKKHPKTQGQKRGEGGESRKSRRR